MADVGIQTVRVFEAVRETNALLEELPGRLADVLNASIGENTAAVLRAVDRRRRRRSPLPSNSNGPTEAEKA